MKPLRYLPIFALLSVFPTTVLAASVNDPLFDRQWSLRQTQVPAAWDTTFGSPSVVVAVIDSGIDDRNPDFTGALWTNAGEIPGNGLDDDHDGYIDDIHGWNFQSQTSSTLPMRQAYQLDETYGHGTAIASIIAARANDRYGMAGVAPRATIMPLVVLDGDGYGTNTVLAEAIRYAVAQKARIINVSVTGYEDDENVRYALKEAERAGVLVVTAVGNSSDMNGYDLATTPVYPACDGADDASSTMLRVTGTDSLDQHAPYANYGASCTDIAAPGHELIGAHPIDLPENSDSTTTYEHVAGLTGTSVASPMVAGAAALIASANPSLSATEIRSILLTTTDVIEPNVLAGSKGKLGYGRLNVERAVKKAVAHAGAVSPAVPATSTKQQRIQWEQLFHFWLGK
ncbi:MAG: S8 family serine peptidase [Patescibacteria group bacterium]